MVTTKIGVSGSASSRARLILFEDGGIVSVGGEGEARYGRKNFLEIFSVFLSPPLFTIFHGRREIGQVHEDTFRRSSETATFITLGGRGWLVTHVDWDRRRAFVEPSERYGKSRWIGSGQPMRFELAQAVKAVLVGPGPSERMSRRTAEALDALRAQYSWCEEAATILIRDSIADTAHWWTFAGDRYNAAVAAFLMTHGVEATYDSFAVWTKGASWQRLPDLIRAAADEVAQAPQVLVTPEMQQRTKFSDCLPSGLRDQMLTRRMAPSSEVEAVRTLPVRVVVQGG